MRAPRQALSPEPPPRSTFWPIVGGLTTGSSWRAARSPWTLKTHTRAPQLSRSVMVLPAGLVPADHLPLPAADRPDGSLHCGSGPPAPKLCKLPVVVLASHNLPMKPYIYVFFGTRIRISAG